MKRSVVMVLSAVSFVILGTLTACATNTEIGNGGNKPPTTVSLPPTASSQVQDIASSTTVSSTGAVSSTSAPAFTATASKTRAVPIPAVGAEFFVPREYEDWTVVQFSYDVIHQQGSDYHFPWLLTIRNDTDRELSLAAYVVHWGFHDWVGWVSKTPFLLKARETKSLSGEDIFNEVFYEQMLYLESIQIEAYIAEVAS